MQLDETILQTRTVTTIVDVLKKIVDAMNPLIRETQDVYEIIKEHDKAKAKVKFQYE